MSETICVTKTFKTEEQAAAYSQMFSGKTVVLGMWHEDETRLFCVCDETLVNTLSLAIVDPIFESNTRKSQE